MRQNNKKAVIIIPARMASSRFPNKPLCQIHGMSMIERVYRLAQANQHDAQVVIATDDNHLKDYAQAFGARVILTPSDCYTGTDRVTKAYEQLAQAGEIYDVIVNLQGDAVLTPPWVIDALIKQMIDNPSLNLATPCVLLSTPALYEFVSKKQAGSSSGTCVVFDKNYDALYFSKNLIPFHRNRTDIGDYCIYRHIGLYAYTPASLLELSNLEPTLLEKIEQLEPLRALENGIKIRMVVVDYKNRSHGSVDNPEDVALVEQIILQEGELAL